MTLEEVYEFYGSANKAADAVRVSRQAFYVWAQRGFIPVYQQKKFQRLTKGELKADKDPKANIQPLDLDLHFPMYRYYSEHYGMCVVRSLTFRAGKVPRITFCLPENRLMTFTSFNIDNLMQATKLKDKAGFRLYEGDVIIVDDSNGFTFKNIHQLREMQFDDFLIIGNIHEGSYKDGYKRS